MPIDPPPLDRQRAFWDQAALDHVLIAILDTPGTRSLDPRAAWQAFDTAGVEARSLLGFMHPEARVVDLDCGIGRVLRPLAAHCKEIIGVDISSEMLERARGYLAGLDNVRLVRTPGRSLPGVEDASVDFLYSLLCLIHVDRRSTFRYLGEIRRVLRPGGAAYLQLQDITTAGGMRKFLDVVDTDYPLEFYTVPEIRRFLRANGLDALSIEVSGEYMLVTVPGVAGAWCARIRRQVRVLGFESRGALAGDRFDPGQDGELVARVEVGADTRLSVRLVLALGTGRDGPIGAAARADGFLTLRPGSTMVLRFRYLADEPGRLAVAADDAEVKALRFLCREPLPPGPATLTAAMLPLGHAWDDFAVRSFPGYFLVKEMDVPRRVDLGPKPGG